MEKEYPTVKVLLFTGYQYSWCSWKDQTTKFSSNKK